MPSERGEYRPLFVRLLNGPSFLELSADARSCFYPLKLRLPAAGIGVISGLVAVLVEDTALPAERVEAALEELERTDWLRRDRNVVWLTRGLEFEPTLNPKDRKHRKHIQGILASLPTLPILDEFRARYSQWFSDAAPEEVDSASAGASKLPPSPIEAPAKPLSSTTPTPTPTPNSTTTTARALPPAAGSPRHLALADRMTQDRYRSALEGYLRAAHDPPRLLEQFELVVNGLAGPGGRSVTPDQLGAALNAMAIAGAKCTEKILAAFVLREIEPPKPKHGNGTRAGDAKTAGTLATMDRFLQRHQVADA